MQEAAHLLLVQFLSSRSRDDVLMASHFSPLSPGQFHFVEGVDVGSPSTPEGLPPGAAPSALCRTAPAPPEKDMLQ
jgi:hypothetical protein